MSSLPPSAPRKHLHTRQVRFDGYHREDGLWDIEATLTDTKAYVWHSADKGALPAGTPLHDMVIRLTLDDKLTIKAIATAMPGTPHGECIQANDPMQVMVGHTIGPGWRMTIEKNLGGIKGCTHLRELLFNMATAAYQTIPGYRAQLRREAGLPERDTDQPPFYLGKCLGWDFDGPAVLRHYPQFVGLAAAQADGARYVIGLIAPRCAKACAQVAGCRFAHPVRISQGLSVTRDASSAFSGSGASHLRYSAGVGSPSLIRPLARSHWPSLTMVSSMS